MKKLLLLISLSTLLFSEMADRMYINLNADADGSINPNISIPIYWNDSLFSAIGYASSNYYEVGPLESLVNSRIGTVIDESSLKLNVLTYEYKAKFLTYALGAEIESITINTQAFGYFESPATWPYAGDIIAATNSIEIEVIKPNIYADATYRNDDLLLRLSGAISPMNRLKVKQTTVFQPLVSTNGTSDSTTYQNISYDLKLIFKYKLSSLMTLHLDSEYSYLPQTYDLAVLNATADGFTTTTIDVQDTSLSNTIKISFNIDSFSKELSPSIGYGMQSISSKDIPNDTTSTSQNNVWILGFEGRF